MNVECYVKSIGKMGDKYHAKLAELGESFTGRKLAKDAGIPGWVEEHKPRARECYMNAAKYVILNDDDWSYYEGYWMWNAGAFPVHHAWLVDADGNVIDLTAEDCDRHADDSEPSADEYFGMMVPTWFVRQEAVRTMEWGVVSDRWMQYLAEEEEREKAA